VNKVDHMYTAQATTVITHLRVVSVSQSRRAHMFITSTRVSYKLRPTRYNRLCRPACRRCCHNTDHRLHRYACEDTIKFLLPIQNLPSSFFWATAIYY